MSSYRHFFCSGKFYLFPGSSIKIDPYGFIFMTSGNKGYKFFIHIIIYYPDNFLNAKMVLINYDRQIFFLHVIIFFPIFIS